MMNDEILYQKWLYIHSPEGGAPETLLVQSQFSCLKTEQTYIESVILRERTVLDSQSYCLSLVQMLLLVFVIFSLLKGE